MTDATGAAFVETKESRRFRAFRDACRRERHSGLGYGPPGVGKTLSARHYADWDRVASADPYAGRGVFRSDEVPGHGCVLDTATVVNSPRPIEDDSARLRRQRRALVLQAIRAEAEPVIASARRKFDEQRNDFRVNPDWFTGRPERLQQAEAAVSEAILDRTERSWGVNDPTDLLLIDAVDRITMSDLEQLRALFDRGGIGVVRIGMPGLERRLARYAQWDSRIGLVHEFRAPGASGGPRAAGALASAGGPAARGPAGRCRGGRGDHPVTGGNFRWLDRLLTQVGRILESNGLKTVPRALVEAAREVLVIGAA